MECNHPLASSMVAYLDGELDPTGCAAYAAHMQGCAVCSHNVQEIQQLTANLKAEAPRYAAPSHLRFRIQADLDALKPRATKIKTSTWGWMNVGISGACALAFSITMMMYLSIPTQAVLINQEIIASHYRSLLANHLSDVVSSDHHTVKPWFTGKLDYVPVVDDFAADGFPLLGGRLDYINKRTVAALAYRHGNHLINVFMWPEAARQGDKNSAPTTTTVQGFNLLQWSESGMAYSAVSDMSSEELLRLRQLIMTHKG
jgi:anti-sigma factor RsiW